MRSYKIMAMVMMLLLGCFSIGAAQGFLATGDNIQLLKQDLVDENLQVGRTRLKYIRKYYGDPPKISEDGKKIVYEYPTLKLEFEKKRLMLSWEYDTFKDPVYTEDADELRYDLESKEIAGNHISYNYIVRNYGEPTDMIETENDGMRSIYYYGDIKLIFENIITLKKYTIVGYSEDEERSKRVFVVGPKIDVPEEDE